VLVPITNTAGFGAVLRLQKRDAGIAVTMVGGTMIFASVSGRDPALEEKLDELYAAGPASAATVASVRLDAHAREASCWLHAPDVCLSTTGLELVTRPAP